MLTRESHRVIGVIGTVFFLKSTNISIDLRALSSKFFWLLSWKFLRESIV